MIFFDQSLKYFSRSIFPLTSSASVVSQMSHTPYSLVVEVVLTTISEVTQINWFLSPQSLIVECDLAACLAEAVLGPAGVLPQVLLRHVVDPQPHEAVVVGGGALVHRRHELVLPV